MFLIFADCIIFSTSRYSLACHSLLLCDISVTSEPLCKASSRCRRFLGWEYTSGLFNTNTQDVSSCWGRSRLPVRFCLESGANDHQSVFWGQFNYCFLNADSGVLNVWLFTDLVYAAMLLLWKMPFLPLAVAEFTNAAQSVAGVVITVGDDKKADGNWAKN